MSDTDTAYVYMCMCMYGPNCRRAWKTVAPQHPPRVRLPATVKQCMIACVPCTTEHSGLALARRDGAHGYEGHSLQGGHVKHCFGGHACRLHGIVCSWLQDSPSLSGRASSARTVARQARPSVHGSGFAAGFKKSLSFQMCVIKQDRGSLGEAIWIIELNAGAKGTLCKVAMLRMSLEHKLATAALQVTMMSFEGHGDGHCADDAALDLITLTPVS